MVTEGDPVEKAADAAELDVNVIANLRMAREAAAREAEALGYEARVSHAFLSGDAENVGRRLALELQDAWPGVYVWGGEPSVCLPPQPGRGGRNQHLALAAANVIAGRDDIIFLSAGTDGTDGPGEDAGALVDGGTLGRGERDGFKAEACLRSADSGSLLEASGDLINTGPTGTNVMDLIIGLKLGERRDG
jgi:glycerate 2-kinase